MKQFQTVTLWVIVTVLCFAPYLSYAQSIRVIDGDTLRIGKERIRLIGFDAPEKNRTLKGVCNIKMHWLAIEAEKFLRSLITDKSKMITLNRTGEQDRYDRTLAYLYVDDVDIAQIMIEKGLAVKYECQNGKCPAKHDWCPENKTGYIQRDF